jgi:hypothetical protein
VTPSPSIERSAPAHRGVVLTLEFTEAKRLFGNNASEHTGCITAGFAVVGGG